MAKREADVVEPIEQAVAAEGIDGELGGKALIVTQRFVFERDVEKFEIYTKEILLLSTDAYINSRGKKFRVASVNNIGKSKKREK